VAPETEGVACGVDDPIEEAMCKHPELRGLKPLELAKVLRVSPAKAQIAILNLAARTTKQRIVFQGISFDEAISRAGRSAPKSDLRFSEDAAGFGGASAAMSGVATWAKSHMPMIVTILIVAALLFEGKNERE